MRPNSWAAVSLWRRFLKLKEDEEAEQIDTIISAWEQSNQGSRPIESAYAREQMQDFRRATQLRHQQATGWQSSNSPPSTQASSSRTTTSPATNDSHHHIVQQHEEQVLSRPNLAIGSGSMYLAQ